MKMPTKNKMKALKFKALGGPRLAKGAKVSYGDVDVPEEAFAPESVRVAISIKVPSDVLDKIRKLAQAEGLPYQTYINKVLHDVANGAGSLSQRLERIERTLNIR